MQRAIDVADVQMLHKEFGIRARRGEVLAKQGEVGGLYLVLRGRVVLTRGRDGAAGNQVLRVVGAGETFGGVAALADAPYDATARALDDVEALCVPADRLIDLYRISPRVALNISQEMAEQVLASTPVADLHAAPVTEPPSAADLAPAVAAIPATPPATGPAISPDVEGIDLAAPEPPVNPDADDEPVAVTAERATLDPTAIVPSLRTGPQTAQAEAADASSDADAPAEREALSAFYMEARTCHVCGHGFEAQRIRTSALKPRRRESDLRTIYEGINPIHYGIDVCPNCYYAAMAEDWDTITEDERRRLATDGEARRAAITLDLDAEREPAVASLTYLLALRCYDMRSADPRRRASILHRLAWLARETSDADMENEYLRLAYNEYRKAFETDGQLSEGGAVTMSYLLGDLALRLSRLDEGLRWFESTLRMDAAKRHPEIQRLTRERWADARELRRASA